MKKIMFIVCMVLWLNSGNIKAEIYKYATTEDILFDIISPEIGVFVDKYYGEDVSWSMIKILEIERNMERFEKGYRPLYRIVLQIKAERGRREPLGLDTLTLHIDPKKIVPYEDPEVRKYIKGPGIELLKYDHKDLSISN